MPRKREIQESQEKQKTKNVERAKKSKLPKIFRSQGIQKPKIPVKPTFSKNEIFQKNEKTRNAKKPK